MAGAATRRRKGGGGVRVEVVGVAVRAECGEVSSGDDVAACNTCEAWARVGNRRGTTVCSSGGSGADAPVPARLRACRLPRSRRDSWLSRDAQGPPLQPHRREGARGQGALRRRVPRLRRLHAGTQRQGRHAPEVWTWKRVYEAMGESLDGYGRCRRGTTGRRRKWAGPGVERIPARAGRPAIVVTGRGENARLRR